MVHRPEIADNPKAEPNEICPLYDPITKNPEKTADELCVLAARSKNQKKNEQNGVRIKLLPPLYCIHVL